MIILQFSVILLASHVLGSPLFPGHQTVRPPLDFLDAGIEMSRATILMAHAAIEKAENSDVRAFARSITLDYSRLLHRLEDLQQHRTSTTELPPDPTDVRGGRAELRNKAEGRYGNNPDDPGLSREHRENMRQLSGLSGMQFDREFLRLVSTEQQNAIRLFEQETRRTGAAQQPADSAKLAQDSLPMLRQHFSEAEQLLQQIERR